ncbi:MAG: arabinan endo-1,5-alpha-L-arabinosidase [Bacteroidales bacterium]|nr:arabinan endo-1,5-alpha-L-arabinosidase [Bacteroidales bacterium]
MNIRSFTLIALCGMWIAACSKPDEGTGIPVKPTPDPVPGPGEETVVIPDYDDDYRSIAGWDYHTKWNLANVHDPSIAYYNGYYYMFGTDASYGNEHLKAPSGKHFPGKRSKDLVNWEYIPGAMDEVPSWVKEKLNEFRAEMGLDPIASPQYGYWAPVIRTVNGKLRMYYCIVVDNYIKSGKATSSPFDGSWTERAFIGMRESSDPAGGKWEDKGFVTCSSSDKGKDGWSRKSTSDWNAYFYFNAIDPSYIITPEGKHCLIYGSWHSGFALLELDPATGMPVKSVGAPWADSPEGLADNGFGVRIGSRTGTSRWQGSEAPEIIYKDGYYYLFMAYDGLDVPYNTRVVRSEKIEGPYYDITGRNFTNGRGDCYPIVTHPYKFSQGYGWVGISHCCIFQQEGTGDWFYASQGRLPDTAGGNAPNAVMMGHVRRIVWCPASAEDLDNLWPVALPERYAGLKAKTITKDDIAGAWEHIDLKYDYAKQDGSSRLLLAKDGSMSGALRGSWSFDEAKQYLTLSPADGKPVVAVVSREADWEASPRTETLVYAGTEKDLNATWWGKKVSD